MGREGEAEPSGPLLTEGFADVGNRLEDPVREVDLHLHVLHVGQLQAEQLVLRRELQLGVSLDPVLVQRPVSFQEPRLLLFPPQRVIRPVLLDICNKDPISPVKTGTRTNPQKTSKQKFRGVNRDAPIDPKRHQTEVIAALNSTQKPPRR